METAVYTLKGKKDGKIELPQSIFGQKLNSDFLQQVIVSQKANQRRNIAHTKGRGEVRGGGKKPWRQKGTGRARAGSNRSPLWKGGGVTFGPNGKEYFKKNIPRRFKKLALLMALSSKFYNKELIVLEDLKIKKPKTKYIIEILKELSLDSKSCFIALPGKDINIIRAVHNIPQKKVEELRNISALDVLSYKYFLTTESGIKFLKDKFGK